MPTELHIGIDSEKVVVARYPIKLRTGRARRHRAGSLTEMVPIAPTGRTRAARVTFAARLSLPLFFSCALIALAGVPLWLSVGASLAAIGTVWRRQSRAAEPGTFQVSRSADTKVLLSSAERFAYTRAVVVARRVRRTWPGLSGMIDPATADHSLTRALDDLATIMARRQDIRRLRAELAGVRPEAVPAASPAVLALADQRDRVERLWRETGEQADRILHSIEATALAGETFLHEQRIGETVRQAELVLAGLSAGAPSAETGPDLADRTATVISAYRDLAGAGQS
jgi:hypothetical protein